MREAVFRYEVKQSLQSIPNLHCVILPDAPFSSGTSFQHKRPYDLFAVCEGNFYGIELKQVRNSLRFPFSSVADHQEFYLNEVKLAKGTPILGINFRGKVPPSGVSTFGKTVNKAFFIRADWVFLEKESGKKSLRLEDLTTLSRADCPVCVELNRIKVGKKYLWDMNFLLTSQNLVQI